MIFSKRFAVSILTFSTFLTPVHSIQAQEKACVAVTEVSGDVQIIWSKSPDITELVEDAQKLEISPEDYKKLCGGEEGERNGVAYPAPKPTMLDFGRHSRPPRGTSGGLEYA